jgi:hypothetical protein
VPEFVQKQHLSVNGHCIDRHIERMNARTLNV